MGGLHEETLMMYIVGCKFRGGNLGRRAGSG